MPPIERLLAREPARLAEPHPGFDAALIVVSAVMIRDAVQPRPAHFAQRAVGKNCRGPRLQLLASFLCRFPRRTEKLLPDLYQLVFAFSDDEYRTRRVPYDPFGGTAHEHMFEVGMAMSCDDDKIGFAIACDVGDYFKGRAHSDNHFF